VCLFPNGRRQATCRRFSSFCAVQADPQITAGNGMIRPNESRLASPVSAVREVLAEEVPNTPGSGRAVGFFLGPNGRPNEKTAAAYAGRSQCRPALAAFLKRPQAELQIGAEQMGKPE